MNRETSFSEMSCWRRGKRRPLRFLSGLRIPSDGAGNIPACCRCCRKNGRKRCHPREYTEFRSGCGSCRSRPSCTRERDPGRAHRAGESPDAVMIDFPDQVVFMGAVLLCVAAAVGALRTEDSDTRFLCSRGRPANRRRGNTVSFRPPS